MASSDDLLELARIFYDYTKSPRVEKLITRLESRGEAKAALGSAVTPPVTGSAPATPLPADEHRYGDTALRRCEKHGVHSGPICHACEPPPADEVSNETLRMFAATIARDNESLRVTARAALAARADLAAARRERDEARSDLAAARKVVEAARVARDEWRAGPDDWYEAMCGICKEVGAYDDATAKAPQL